MSVEPREARRRARFCAVVPGKHAFTLAGGVYTGNCGACEPECPVEAIFPEDALPEKWEPFVKINYAYPRRGHDQPADGRVRNRAQRPERADRLVPGSATGGHSRAMALRPLTLDHVALWVADRDASRTFASSGSGHARRSSARTRSRSSAPTRAAVKLTLFAAEGPREPGALQHVALRVSIWPPRRPRLPGDRARALREGEVYFDVAEGLRHRARRGADADVEYDLDHVALVVPDPEELRRRLAPARLPSRPPGPSEPRGWRSAGAYRRVPAGEEPGESERPLLNHLAVTSTRRTNMAAQAVEAGAEIVDVEGRREHVRGLRLKGPERVKVEYVEHKPSFSLV